MENAKFVISHGIILVEKLDRKSSFSLLDSSIKRRVTAR